ncbi:MAG TPA: tRNA (N(6)-L-threonylcarbamoyladenosine(37)-C(2))-methylthiotransferase MtaB [Nitrospiria bacterium]
MKVAFHTMGCKVNQFDTAVMAEVCGQSSYEVVPFDGGADVYVINTCSVTENGDREARRIVRRVKRDHPGARVVVTGCYAQTQPENVAEIEGVDLVLGNKGKTRIHEFLEGCGGAERPRIELGALDSGEALDQPAIQMMRGRTRVFLKIQDGCDFKCSFCLIPRARGAGRSLPMDRVVDQIRTLGEVGCQEVVLTGINLGMYGRDFSPKARLSDLLNTLLEKTDIPRIRLSSIEPKTLTAGLLDLWASSDRICKHFHIPLQSGDDRILADMNRHYEGSFFRQLIQDISEKVPEACFGTDVMVGFPGEGEREFLNTASLLECLPWAYFHVFPYSPRPDTEALSFREGVHEDEKRRRGKILRALSDKKKGGISKRL